VIGYRDPNPTVKGNGIDFLRTNGVDVVYGVLEKQCQQIIHPFLKHSSTGKPWVVMKAGMSLDGKITYKKNECGKITGKESNQFTHKLRDTVDAILIGIDTALIDNPSLTTRLAHGKGKDPHRIILDSQLKLSPDAKVLALDSEADTILCCTAEASVIKKSLLTEAGAKVIEITSDEVGHVCVESVLSVLGENNISSVLVEGGARIHGSFLTRKLVDELHLFIAPFFIGDQGTPIVTGYTVTEKIKNRQKIDSSVELLGDDIHYHEILNNTFSLMGDQEYL
jgi:diaminohydroxyphosphoribosylaminopyrimidine deaminase/5-amino-6-(5-phosphoribosylamino)uracil reductase